MYLQIFCCKYQQNYVLRSHDSAKALYMTLLHTAIRGHVHFYSINLYTYKVVRKMQFVDGVHAKQIAFDLF